MTTLNSSWQTLDSKEHYSGGWLALTLKLQAKLNKQDTTKNQSVIDTRIYAEITNSGAYYYYGYEFKCSYATTISGNPSTMQVLNSSKTLITGQGTVNHDSSGNYSGSISGSVYLSTPLNSSLSGSFDLPKINVNINPPSDVLVSGYGDGTVANGEQLTINWTTVSGANSYDYEYTLADGSWGGTTNSTVGNQKIDISGRPSGQEIQARVRTVIGSNKSDWKVSSNSQIVSGAMDTKVSGTWKKGNTWVKVSNSWKRAKRVWTKVNGEWKQST